MKPAPSSRVAQHPAPRRGRGGPRAKSVQGIQRSSRPRPLRRPTANPLLGELSALRGEVERIAANLKEAIQKIERLTLAVADLHDDVADLQASLSDGEVEYGAVEEDNSEMGEGHA